MKRPRILIVDNYDSFTHNVAHALRGEGAECTLVASDAATAAELCALDVDGFVISAGPCTPTQAGVSLELVSQLGQRRPSTPLLGLCLGHQAIAVARGAVLRRATQPLHGKVTAVRHDGAALFEGLPSPLAVARYNSLVVEEGSLPSSLLATAWDEHDDVMALRHVTLPHVGLQFHPESWLCPHAIVLLHRWLNDTAEVAHRTPLRQAHAP